MVVVCILLELLFGMLHGGHIAFEAGVNRGRRGYLGDVCEGLALQVIETIHWVRKNFISFFDELHAQDLLQIIGWFSLVHGALGEGFESFTLSCLQGDYPSL